MNESTSVAGNVVLSDAVLSLIEQRYLTEGDEVVASYARDDVMRLVREIKRLKMAGLENRASPFRSDD